MIAFVDEEKCIGCAKCVAICQVRAIAFNGIAKVGNDCIGCEVCTAVCPVNAISMVLEQAHNR